MEVVERQTLMRHYFNETILLDRAALNISVKAKCLQIDVKINVVAN